MSSGNPRIRIFMVSRYSLSGCCSSNPSEGLSILVTPFVPIGSATGCFLSTLGFFVGLPPPPAVSIIIGFSRGFAAFYSGTRTLPAALPEFFEDDEGGRLPCSYELFLLTAFCWFCIFKLCGSPLDFLVFACVRVPLAPFVLFRCSKTDFKFFILSHPCCLITEETTALWI